MPAISQLLALRITLAHAGSQDCPQPRDAEAIHAAQQAFNDAKRARGAGGGKGATPKRCA